MKENGPPCPPSYGKILTSFTGTWMATAVQFALSLWEAGSTPGKLFLLSKLVKHVQKFATNPQRKFVRNSPICREGSRKIVYGTLTYNDHKKQKALMIEW